MRRADGAARAGLGLLAALALGGACQGKREAPVARAAPVAPAAGPGSASSAAPGDAATRAHADAAAPPAPIAPTGPVEVPSPSKPIAIDGEWEPDWNDRAARAVLHGDDGAEARPYSEVRLLHQQDRLLVALYAADEDIRSGEHFDLTVGALAVKIDPKGVVTPPVAGVKTAMDVDGTLDAPADFDEEWKIEMTIPVAALGAVAGANLPIHVARCDTPKDGVVRCGAWDGQLAPVERWK